VAGKRVLELGSGCGLAGLVAATPMHCCAAGGVGVGAWQQAAAVGRAGGGVGSSSGGGGGDTEAAKQVVLTDCGVAGGGLWSGREEGDAMLEEDQGEMEMEEGGGGNGKGNKCHQREKGGGRRRD